MKRILHSVFCAIIITVLAAGFYGCVFVNFGEFNAAAGKGDMENYKFDVGEYNRINAEGQYEIRYYAAPSGTVTLTVQPNLLEYYEVEVINGELVVNTTKKVTFSSSQSAVLTVSSPVLNSVTITGAGKFIAHDKITADSFTLILNGAAEGKADLDVNSLFVNLSGAGSFNLSGNADTASLKLSGAGDLNALSLQTRDATVDMSGAGTVRVYSTGSLQINADGVGNVEYKGSPSLNLNRDGLVSIKRLD